MKEDFYIHLEEFSKNDYNFAILMVVENVPFSYDVGRSLGTREEVLVEISERTIVRNPEGNPHHLKFTDAKDARMMTSIFENDERFKKYKVEASPAVFSIDENNVEMVKDIVKKHSLKRRMFDQHIYEYF